MTKVVNFFPTSTSNDASTHGRTNLLIQLCAGGCEAGRNGRVQGLDDLLLRISAARPGLDEFVAIVLLVGAEDVARLVCVGWPLAERTSGEERVGRFICSGCSQARL